jgi:hypothetical protein
VTQRCMHQPLPLQFFSFARTRPEKGRPGTLHRIKLILTTTTTTVMNTPVDVCVPSLRLKKIQHPEIIHLFFRVQAAQSLATVQEKDRLRGLFRSEMLVVRRPIRRTPATLGRETAQYRERKYCNTVVRRLGRASRAHWTVPASSLRRPVLIRAPRRRFVIPFLSIFTVFTSALARRWPRRSRSFCVVRLHAVDESCLAPLLPLPLCPAATRRCSSGPSSRRTKALHLLFPVPPSLIARAPPPPTGRRARVTTWRRMR